MGQTATTATLCCLKTEQELEKVVGGIHPHLRDIQTFGTYRAVLDSMREGTTESVQTQNGFHSKDCADREVSVKFKKLSCLETVDCTPFGCDASPVPAAGYEYDKTTVDECVDYKFSISPKDFDCTCEDPNVELARHLRDAYRAIANGVNCKTAELLAAGVGLPACPDGVAGESTLTTPINLPLFNAAGKPQPMGAFPLLNQYEDMGVGGIRPYMVSGSSKFAAYQMAGGVFAGNVDGFDPNRGIDFNPYRDRKIVDAVTAAGGTATNPVISWLPGAVQFLEWFEFETEYTQIGPSGRVTWAPVQASGTMTRQKVDIGTPFNGTPLIVDMQIRYDECDGVGGRIHYHIKKCFDLWKIPQAAFNADCNQCHNYCLLSDIVCEDVTCDTYC